MKKQFNTAFIFAIMAMVGGVFYREFTKFSGFTGKTSLAVVHTHFFLLGMVMLLLVGLFCKQFGGLTANRKMKHFNNIYYTGVCITGAMLLVRGIPQVRGIELSKGISASISGLSGIGHVLTGIGIILFLLALKEEAAKEDLALSQHESREKYSI